MERKLNRPVLSVSQLTAQIKQQLEGCFKEVFIEGELSNFKNHSSGHLYFSLKDSDAQISAAMFRGNASRLTALPKDGDQVIVRGEINVYPPRGQYQIIVRELFFVGAGALLMRLEALKKELAARGWFEKRRPLPKFPKRIGVITSKTGAAIQDIINILSRRHSGFSLLLAPVKVQGAGAAEEVAEAIRCFNSNSLADVLIIGRGGGSIEDLWAFNEEIVAEAIYKSEIPVISAVGHETDNSISDLVADVRAPTPSAAAEIVLAEKEGQIAFLSQSRQRIEQALSHLLRVARQRLDSTSDLLSGAVGALLQRRKLRLTGYARQAAALSPKTRIAHYRQRFASIGRSIDLRKRVVIESKKERLSSLTKHLCSVDPRNVLKKGYSILFEEKSGSVIKSVSNLKGRVQARLADGEVTLEVINDI